MLKNIQKRIAKLPPLLRNIYFLCGVVFGVWMLFLDENNLLNQYRKHHELSSLLAKKKFYVQQIGETQKELTELTADPATQEKFAREHYWMKRDKEDVFVIVKK
ncbi:MAG: septum formation initiator [Bacteroidota bacterium]|nr:septum formation initiator [Bacteroidota bacterium]